MDYRELNLIPDWPRIRKLVAEQWGISESEVQTMMESDESLHQVELRMAIEEVLESLRR
jgi:hypothetical protein